MDSRFPELVCAQHRTPLPLTEVFQDRAGVRVRLGGRGRARSAHSVWGIAVFYHQATGTTVGLLSSQEVGLQCVRLV